MNLVQSHYHGGGENEFCCSEQAIQPIPDLGEFEPVMYTDWTINACSGIDCYSYCSLCFQFSVQIVEELVRWWWWRRASSFSLFLISWDLQIPGFPKKRVRFFFPFSFMEMKVVSLNWIMFLLVFLCCLMQISYPMKFYGLSIYGVFRFCCDMNLELLLCYV